MKILCSLGFHKWKSLVKAVFETLDDELIANAKSNAQRICTVCDKKQEVEVHCLGLNPPEYYINYKTLKDI